MKILLLITFVLFPLAFLSAQQLVLSNYAMNLSDHVKNNRMLQAGLAPGELFEGSPYLADTFSSGRVVTYKGLFENVQMKYNIYMDYIEYLDKTHTYVLDPKVEIMKVEILDAKLFVQPYFEKDNSIKLGYFFMLDSNKISLMKKKIIKFQPGNPSLALVSSGTISKFSPLADVFYIKIAGQAAKPLNSIKKLADEFPDHQKEIDAFITRHKSKLKEIDLKEIWKYYGKQLNK